MKKNKIAILIIIGIVIIGIICYLGYNKLFATKEVIKQQDNIVSLNKDFYNINTLIKNKYIKLINDFEQKKYNTNEETNPYMIKIQNNKVFVGDDLNAPDKDINLVEAKGIIGTPYVVKYLSYQSPTSVTFLALTKEKNLYYATVKEKDDKIIVNEFKQINKEKINNLYDFYTDKNITYPWYPLTVYAETETGELQSVSNGIIASSFKRDYPLLDQICGGWSEKDSCVGLYISPDRNLYLMKNKKKKIYQELRYKDKKIKIKDAFSITKIKATAENASLEEIKYYIIGKDNYLYEITENKDYEITSIKKYSNEEITSYKYNDENHKFTASINYKDGSKDYFKNVSVFSSIYYRYNS